MVSDYRHGGAILIVPDEESCKEFVDIKYRLPSGYLFSDSERLEELSGNAREKEIVTYADLIAKLTSVDGSVVLTKDLHLLGFGAETLVDKMGSKHPAMQFMEFDNTENTRKQFKDNGMRHRAGYRFCSAVPDSVAFVISARSMKGKSSCMTMWRCRWYEERDYGYQRSDQGAPQCQVL